MSESKKHPLYRHYKGGLYRKLAEATHSETQELMVIYQSETDGRVWARPAAMWDETVTVENQKIQRFQQVEEA